MKLRNEHLDIIYRWLKYSNHVDMAATLHSLSFHTIAIYGGGVLGELLYDQLYSTDIEIKCVIDQNPDLAFPYDVDVVLPSQFSDDGCDAVIVAPFVYYDSVKESLQVNCPIISLNHLIVDIDVLHNLLTAIRNIEQAGAQLLIIDVTNAVAGIKNPSTLEVSMLAHHHLKIFVQESPKVIDLLLKYYDDLPADEEYIRSVYFFSFKMRTFVRDGIIFLQDVESKYFNIVNGLRHTAGNPKTYDHTIRFFGNCLASGAFAEDALTIESQLQELINTAPLHNKTYRVLNCANWQNCQRAIPAISNTEFHCGDIAVLIIHQAEWLKYYINSKAIYFYDLKGTFDRPHSYGEVFFNALYHTNHRGYKLIANKIYSILSELLDDSESKVNFEPQMKKLNYLKKQNNFTPCKVYSKSAESELTLNNHLSFLKNEKVDCSGTVGAIVMNCNPFTLGHKYLIEEARKQCDFLYIFVVEEDKSFFSFADRLMLVKANTAEMNNVKVLPSGNFIISTLTFPEYFMKSENIKIDASKDIEVFAESIAPALNITKRFVGEEPLDPITNQYNQAMIEELPRSGIAVTEIPRKQSAGIPISASLVRKLLEKRDFDEISNLVPLPTLEYLKERSEI